jgi:hypothetical protein
MHPERGCIPQIPVPHFIGALDLFYGDDEVENG